MNYFTRLLARVLEWLQFSRRARDQQRVSPQLLREALAEMLTDPETARLLRKSLMPTAIPIRGGSPGMQRYIPKYDSTGLNANLTDTVAPIFEDDNGRVGIGTTNPQYTLDVNGLARTSGAFVSNNGRLIMRDNSLEESVTDGASNLVMNYAGYQNGYERYRSFGIYNGKAGLVTWFDGPTGYVGIGTTSPAEKLEVAGNIKISGSGNGITFPGGTKQTAAWLGSGTVKRTAVYSATNTLTDGKVYDDGLHVAVGASSSQNLSTFTVKANPSLSASGQVSISVGFANVTQTDPSHPTHFLSEVSVGDRIAVTVSGVTYTRTVTSVSSDTLLAVDEGDPKGVFPVTAGSLTMTVFPSIARLDDASSTPKFVVDNNGFLGIAGGPVKDDDGVGYVLCNADHTFADPNNEMRGYQATINYTRTTPDANIGGLGWDVLGHVGAIVLEGMNLPDSDHEIRGYMKPFQSELYFRAPAAGSYTVVYPAINYLASLTEVSLPTGSSLATWAGQLVATPGFKGGSSGRVTTGYGIWIQSLQDSAGTLVADSTAAIRIEGPGNYGRILWNSCSISCPTTGTLQLSATAVNVAATMTVTNVTSPLTLASGNQETGFCAAGGFAYGIPTDRAAVIEVSTNFKTVMTNEPAGVTITCLSANNLLAIAVKFKDGSQSAPWQVSYPGWLMNQPHVAGDAISDGTNVQLCVTGGASGSSGPSWNGARDGFTYDGSVVWQNSGPATTLAAGNAFQFSRSGKTLSEYGFALVVASKVSPADGDEYKFQGTYVTLGN